MSKSNNNQRVDRSNDNIFGSAKALQYIKNNLSGVAPNGCELKVGDVVDWENDYGVKWRHRVVGFNGGSVHLNTDSYWFPHKASELTVVNG